jgi:uncharacterized membrane protein YkvI
MPPLRWLFQAMIFAALLESGTGSIHAVNQRIASVRPLTRPLRMACSLTLLVIAVFLADRIGLVRLIASGYRMLAWAFLAVYVLPLLTVGVWKLAR